MGTTRHRSPHRATCLTGQWGVTLHGRATCQHAAALAGELRGMAPRRRDDASAALNALGVSLEGATLSKDAIVKLLKARARGA
jgi:hypothetical protein